MDPLRALWETVRGLPRLRQFLSLVLLVLVTGVGGYMLLGWSFLDAVYMTIITVTTVGYREVRPLTPVGEVFTMVVILMGVGSALYALTSLIQYVIEGHFDEGYRRRRMEQRLARLRDHYIVCGYGRMGKTVAKELSSKGIDIIAIEKNPVDIEDKEGPVLIEGDATQDEVLLRAGIERARGLISVLPTDAENLFVVLSARGLNPHLHIYTRAGDESSELKILRAGADRVVSPYHTGGLRIANMILKPAVVDFIELATKSGNLEIQIEEIEIRPGSALSGKTLEVSGIGRDLGIIIVAVKKPDGTMQFNPTSRTVINPQDTLIALGEKSKLKVLEGMSG